MGKPLLSLKSGGQKNYIISLLLNEFILETLHIAFCLLFKLIQGNRH